MINKNLIEIINIKKIFTSITKYTWFVVSYNWKKKSLYILLHVHTICVNLLYKLNLYNSVIFNLANSL